MTKRHRKRTLRLKASSIEELTEKLCRHANKFYDFEIETPMGDPDYWKRIILQKLFAKTHSNSLF